MTILGLKRESEIAQNLLQDSSFQTTKLLGLGESSNFLSTLPVLGRKPLIGKILNLIPLPARESFFDSVFLSPLLGKVKRPFVKVWRLRGPSD